MNKDMLDFKNKYIRFQKH